MFPRLARECAEADVFAHRFNFSHSGMTDDVATFARPELFERDTWKKQIYDLSAVVAAIERIDCEAGATRPIFILGHSRGGVTALLTASHLTYLNRRRDVDAIAVATASTLVAPATLVSSRSRLIRGVITLAAPSSCNPLTPEQELEMLQQGSIESTSSRTGQKLRVGRAFLQEQIDDPAAHDVLTHVRRIGCPLLVIHGDNDATVPVQAARDIAGAAPHAMLRIIHQGDHVFNTPNPMPNDQLTSPQWREVIDATMAFIASNRASLQSGHLT